MHIAVPDLVSNSYFPAVAAVELGFFREHGIDMELEMVFPVGRAMQALRDGDVDFVAGPAHPTLSAFPGWEGAKLLAALSQHTFWLLVMRSDLEVAPGDVNAIRGLRIGAAPGPDAALRRLLAEAGVDPEADVSLAPVPGSDAAGVSFGIHAAQALRDGAIDGFWANAMGAEVAVQSGIGKVVLDPRRGLGPAAARDYTFAALVTTERLIEESPDMAEGAVRAVVAAQRALRADPSRAVEVGRRLFPADEAELIEDLIRRDAPYYSSEISLDAVASLNGFCRNLGLLDGDAVYEQVVASQFAHLWSEG
ncbi:MAG: ABC transporter substrate-binding protein [Chloroflexota bacterium]|nr:ABC transporter substrate-binding protein [Chloroflexota bacterium]